MGKLLFIVMVTLVFYCLGFIGVHQVFAANSGPVNPYSFSVKPGTYPGVIDVNWVDDNNTNRYNLTYGTDPNKPTFGQIDLPFTKNANNLVTIGFLNPGTTYYFFLEGETNYGTNNSGPVETNAPTNSAISTQIPAATNSSSGISGVTPSNSPSGPIGPYNFLATSESGAVRITWVDNESANKYDLVYGLTPNQYQFGVQGMPFTSGVANSYTVGFLNKGTRYYFSLVSQKDGNFVSASSPVSAVVN